MSVRVNNIKLSPDADEAEVKEQALLRLHKRESDVLAFRIARQSVDARRKQVQLVYAAELTLKDESALPDVPDIVRLIPEPELPTPTRSLKMRPVVVGTGPCGLFCALTLARAGAPPLILERGAEVDKRTRLVERYWQGGVLDPNTNVQFGEGGAGTFSDGKLTTRIHDKTARQVLTDFHAFGADADILVKAKPHIGTDVLRRVIQNIRQELLALGCEIQFETALTGLDVKNGAVAGIYTSKETYIPCDTLVLAIGHSARDTYEMLLASDVSMAQKPFSVGVRIEHLQKELDRAMYGHYAGHPKLGPAEYQLSLRQGNDACYSFCMCPGGLVVAAASEAESLVTNGMSRRARNEQNANAALCVNVDERHFASDHPLAGVMLQRELERRAFQLAGGAAPVQTVGSFLHGGKNSLGRVQPSYTGRTALCDMTKLFPERIVQMLKAGLVSFGHKIEGFTAGDALLTAPETRTSAPVRILRNEAGESVSHAGLYPAGEGAGYAGGIMSAAVDGIKAARSILCNGRQQNDES
ncbi:MAG: hypothetical protein E7414_01400 [Ruminococcaceae bacterium]|nr:hypothetical protein [Oscillospiraceae bacterium]